MKKVLSVVTVLLVVFLISCSKSPENIAELTAPIVYSMAKNLASQQKYKGEIDIKITYNNVHYDKKDEWPSGEIKFTIEFMEMKGKTADIQYILDGTHIATAIVKMPGAEQKQIKVNLYESVIVFGQTQTVENKLNDLIIPLSKNIKPNSKIAIFDFVDLENKTSLLGKRISESMITHLSQKNYQIVERKLLDPIFQEVSFQETGLAGDSARIKIGQFLGADYILVGTIKIEKEELLINSRVINISNGIIVSSGQTIFPKYLVNSNDLKPMR